MNIINIYEELYKRINNKNIEIIKRLEENFYKSIEDKKEGFKELNELCYFKLKKSLLPSKYLIKNDSFFIMIPEHGIRSINYKEPKFFAGFTFEEKIKEKNYRTVIGKDFLKTCETNNDKIINQIGVLEEGSSEIVDFKDGKYIYNLILENKNIPKLEIEEIILLQSDGDEIEKVFMETLLNIRKIINNEKKLKIVFK